MSNRKEKIKRTKEILEIEYGVKVDAVLDTSKDETNWLKYKRKKKREKRKT